MPVKKCASHVLLPVMSTNDHLAADDPVGRAIVDRGISRELLSAFRTFHVPVRAVFHNAFDVTLDQFSSAFLLVMVQECLADRAVDVDGIESFRFFRHDITSRTTP